MNWPALIAEIIRWLFDYLKRRELISETEMLIANRLTSRANERIKEGRTVREEIAEKTRKDIAAGLPADDSLLLEPSERGESHNAK